MIRVLLVYEIHLFGSAMVSALQNESDIDVVGYTTSSEEALAMLRTCDCDLVLVHASHPDTKTLHFIGNVTEMKPMPRVLVVGLVEATEFILQCLQAGAVGYVLQDATLSDMLQRVRETHRGEAVVSPAVAAALISRLAELSRSVRISDPLFEFAESLTPREEEVLTLITRHYSNRRIADELFIEVGTVKNHVHNILAKLNVDNRRQAAALAPHLLQDARLKTADTISQSTPLAV